jgi:hypothetical protein
LVKVCGDIRLLMDGSELHKFKNEREALFSQFRSACLHLRGEREALDTVAEEEVAVVALRFMFRILRECPYQQKRCDEVFQTLFISDAWRKAFLRVGDACEQQGLGVDAAPQPNMTDKVATAKPEPKAKPIGTSISLTVQPCTSAKLSVDDESSGITSIGSGLVISVSIADAATVQGLADAARFILTSKLIGSAGHAKSIVSLCKRGGNLGIMIIPEPSAVADSDSGSEEENIEYKCTPTQLKRKTNLYNLFAHIMQSFASTLVLDDVPPNKRRSVFACVSNVEEPTLPTIVTGKFHQPDCNEVKPGKPSQQSFTF